MNLPSQITKLEIWPPDFPRFPLLSPRFEPSRICSHTCICAYEARMDDDGNDIIGTRSVEFIETSVLRKSRLQVVLHKFI